MMRFNRTTTGRISRFFLILLLIEFIDELVGGVREAAWPLLREDFALTYFQIGLLMSLPGIFANLVEPVIGILGDTWKRHVLILGGGCLFVASSFLAAAGQGFWWLMVAYVLFNPASGAFVGLSQAVLMDLDPARHDQNMARWTFAGSLGVVLGPLLLGASAFWGQGWRLPFWLVAIFSLLALLLSWPFYRRYANRQAAETQPQPIKTSLRVGMKGALQALRRGEVLRWLVLLEFSDLMMDVLYGYLALYLVDVAGLSPAAASLGVVVWTGVGLIGDFLLIPLLERVPGLVYLRISAALEFVLFPLFLLVEPVAWKFVVLGLVGLFNSGWYAILKGRLYSAMPGQSGTVTTLGSVFGMAGRLVPLLIGVAAQRFGLDAAIWLLMLGPIALLVGLPGQVQSMKPAR